MFRFYFSMLWVKQCFMKENRIKMTSITTTTGTRGKVRCIHSSKKKKLHLKSVSVSTMLAVADPGGARAPLAPPPKISAKSYSFQAILREEPLFWAIFGLRSKLFLGPPWPKSWIRAWLGRQKKKNSQHKTRSKSTQQDKQCCSNQQLKKKQKHLVSRQK